ncbi:MAG: hypothetical protein Q4C42_07755, partial [Clostridia bacterium]|nr:hypothetical protein [Clostridia bacterium]
MKMRKILSLLFALMLVTVFVSNSAMAAGTSMATATSISVNKTYSADTKAGTYYYRFTLPSSGTVTISVPTLNSQVLSIYNTSNVKLYTKTLKSSSPSATLSTAAKTTLSAGTYTLSYNHSSAGKIKSTIKLGYVSSNESFPDSSSDNSYSTANSISLNKTYYGFMPINDHTDYYKFKVGKTSSVKLQFSTTLKKYRLYI